MMLYPYVARPMQIASAATASCQSSAGALVDDALPVDQAW